MKQNFSLFNIVLAVVVIAIAIFVVRQMRASVDIGPVHVGHDRYDYERPIVYENAPSAHDDLYL